MSKEFHDIVVILQEGSRFGCVFVNLEVNKRTYKQKLSVLDELCVDVILGLDFQEMHEKVIIHYGGDDPPLDVCALSMNDECYNTSII